MADVDVLPQMPGMRSAFARALVPSRRKDAVIPRATALVEDYEQDRDRYAAYTRVCGFTLRDEVPPTWLHVLTFPLHIHLLGGADSTVRLSGAVHVSNEMTLHRPVSVDERLSVSVRVDNLRAHRRGALVDLVGEIRAQGERVWTGVSTYLASGMSAPGPAVELDKEEVDPLVPTAIWRLPAGLGRQYRAVSRDPNPIHTSRVAARAFGFPRPIIHGMWTHARALAALEGRLTSTYTAAVSFTRPIFLPGAVGYSSRVTETGHRSVVTNRHGDKPHLILTVRGSQDA